MIWDGIIQIYRNYKFYCISPNSMGNTIQLIKYTYQYGNNHIHHLTSDGDGGFYIAVHHSNIGRTQKDIDNGNAFIWNNKIIYKR